MYHKDCQTIENFDVIQYIDASELEVRSTDFHNASELEVRSTYFHNASELEVRSTDYQTRSCIFHRLGKNL